jgi:hypothetical protein
MMSAGFASSVTWPESTMAYAATSMNAYCSGYPGRFRTSSFANLDDRSCRNAYGCADATHRLKSERGSVSDLHWQYRTSPNVATFPSFRQEGGSNHCHNSWTLGCSGDTSLQLQLKLASIQTRRTTLVCG